MVFENHDVILLPENLDFETYNKLMLFLNERSLLEQVAKCFGIFSECDLQMLMISKRPAEKLLQELGSRLCTIGLFCEILEKCQLFNILMLFKQYEPVKIIEQTFSSDESNVQMILYGEQFKLVCKAVGIPPPKYQWYQDNVELIGKTDSTLLLQNFDLNNEGIYYCIVQQEGYGAISSHSACLMLAPEAPIIIKQPVSQEVCSVGAKVTLTVKAKGHPKLNYQWYKGNQQLDGCTSPTLIIHVKKESQEGKYRCYLYNEGGEVWSKESTIITYVTPQTEPSAKLALLIGNQIYDNLNTLYTPENDVKTLSDLFQELGFMVMALQNLKLVEMRNAIKTFAKMLPPDAYVVFYFAGHGFEIQDKFMLPVDTPGPEEYLQTDAVCERELLKEILSSNPKLFLELLDMCLKLPNPTNKKIFQETTYLHEFEANNNLIQGYSTTSYLGAYEKKTGKNGLYVEHLKQYLTKDKDMPIVDILQKVAKDVAAVCLKQKPFFGTNVTMDYRLTDHCNFDLSTKEKFEKLSLVPEETLITFKSLNLESKVTFSPYLGVFLNTLEVRFTNLGDYKVTCEALGEELSFELNRENNDLLLIKVMNIQRLVASKTLTLSLLKNNDLVDCSIWDIGKPMVAILDLWWNYDLKQCKEEKSFES